MPLDLLDTASMSAYDCAQFALKLQTQVVTVPADISSAYRNAARLPPPNERNLVILRGGFVETWINVTLQISHDTQNTSHCLQASRW